VASVASASQNKPGRMTDRATRVIALAHREADRRGADSVETDHLLTALCQEGHGVAGRFLAAAGVSVSNAAGGTESAEGAGTRWVMLLGDRARQVLDLAAAAAGEVRIDTEHLLLGLLAADASLAARIYPAGAPDLQRLRAEIMERAARKPGALPDLAATDDVLNPLEDDLDRATRHGDTAAFRRLVAERDQLVDARHEQLTAWVADLDGYAALEMVREIRALREEIDRLRVLVDQATLDSDSTSAANR
jgi:ATP-dependent Clp protease ATP-binding subunit ClpA